MSDFSVRSDHVDVEQIMRQIRSRIREKRGVDYTEEEIRELANVKLEKFRDPRGVRSDLLEQFRRKRIGDPLWNGALIGLGAGFGAGLLSMARCDAGLVCGAAAGPVVLVESAVGAGVGIGIDALHRGRKLVYVNRDTAVPSSTPRASINVSPVFGGTTRGVMMSVRF